MAMNAASASQQPQTLGPLVGGVGGPGKVAPPIGTNATHDERVPRNDCPGMTVIKKRDPRQRRVSAVLYGVEVR
jgi:hypothetical protein